MLVWIANLRTTHVRDIPVSRIVSDSGAGAVRREEAAEFAVQVCGPVWLPGEQGYADECAIYT